MERYKPALIFWRKAGTKEPGQKADVCRDDERKRDKRNGTGRKEGPPGPKRMDHPREELKVRLSEISAAAGKP